MKYIIKARNIEGGRKTYVKADKGKSKALGHIVYKGFTRDKHVAYHYDSLEEAKEALRELKVAYDHMSFTIEEHLPYTLNEGLMTEPSDSLLIAMLRAIKLFPEVDFEHLKWADGFYVNMDVFDINEQLKGWERKHTFTITARCGEVHIMLDDNDQASYWATFM